MNCRSPLLLLPLLLPCCLGPTDRTDLLHSVVWVQTAAEREAACIEVFAAATAAMGRRAAELPDDRRGAVIVDVDETMLDNAPYQASLVRDQHRFDEPSWRAWCELAQAAAVPGAVAFAQACQARGVTVFYVTNRGAEVEAATRRNLLACGFPLDDALGDDVVLCKGEVGAGSSKEPRRRDVAERFAVLLLVGDDLNDFVDAESSVAERKLQVRRHLEQWGNTWFLVPNPLYGSWERAVIGAGEDPTAAKFEVLAPTR